MMSCGNIVSFSFFFPLTSLSAGNRSTKRTVRAERGITRAFAHFERGPHVTGLYATSVEAGCFAHVAKMQVASVFEYTRLAIIKSK